MGDKLQNYKTDPISGHLVVNEDKIDIKRMIFEDAIDGCIKFVEPESNHENGSKSYNG